MRLLFLLLFLLAISGAATAQTPPGTLPSPPPPHDSANAPLPFAATMPSFDYPGGYNGWLKKNLEYPEFARENGIQGKVILMLTIEKDGSISDIEISRRAHSTLNQAAIEAIEKMPKWTPGINSGDTVRVRMTIPIIFKLDDGTPLGPEIPSQLTLAPSQIGMVKDKDLAGFTPSLPTFNYPGGWKEWLSANLVYPPEARRNGLEGKVLVSAVVKKNGKLTELKIAESEAISLNKAALEAVKKMPRWKAGEFNGKPIHTRILIPVEFSL